MSSRVIANTRFMLLPRLYASLIKDETENRVAVCEHALHARDSESLKNTADKMDSLLGEYYRLRSEKNWAALQGFPFTLLPPKYQSRALFAIGQANYVQGDSEASHEACADSLRIAARNDQAMEAVQVSMHFAILQADEGDHHTALEGLTACYKLALSIYHSFPSVYFDILNSLAVELCEINKLEEAEYFAKLAVGSPFGYRFPEWSDTARAIEEKKQKTGAARSQAAYLYSSTPHDIPTKNEFISRRLKKMLTVSLNARPPQEQREEICLDANVWMLANIENPSAHEQYLAIARIITEVQP